MRERECLAGLVEQALVAQAALGELALQTAQAQVQGGGDGSGSGLAVGQALDQKRAQACRQVGGVEPRQLLRGQSLVEPRQLGIGALQRPREIGGGKHQAVLCGTEAHRRMEGALVGRSIGGHGPAQLHPQRRDAAGGEPAGGAHLQRCEGIGRFRRGRGLALGGAQQQMAFPVLRFHRQLASVGDDAAVARGACEGLAQRGAGGERIAQRVEGGRLHLARHAQAEGLVAGRRHRQPPEPRGLRHRQAGVRIGEHSRVDAGLPQQGVGIQPRGQQRLADSAGPAGEGGEAGRIGVVSQAIGVRCRAPAVTHSLESAAHARHPSRRPPCTPPR